MENNICTTPAEEMMGVVDATGPVHKPEPVTVRPAKNTSFEKARAAIAGVKSMDGLQELAARVADAAAGGRINAREQEILEIEIGEREGFFLEHTTNGGE